MQKRRQGAHSSRPRRAPSRGHSHPYRRAGTRPAGAARVAPRPALHPRRRLRCTSLLRLLMRRALPGVFISEGLGDQPSRRSQALLSIPRGRSQRVQAQLIPAGSTISASATLSLVIGASSLIGSYTERFTVPRSADRQLRPAGHPCPRPNGRRAAAGALSPPRRPTRPHPERPPSRQKRRRPCPPAADSSAPAQTPP
jgi:hypothetical protein